MNAVLHIGLVVNPVAGLGGSHALKGSDGEAARSLTAQEGGRATQRARRTLEALCGVNDRMHISCWGRDMGESAARLAAIPVDVLGCYDGDLPTAKDTRQAVQTLRDAGVDLLIFAGGDGTARDVYDQVGDSFPVLGIPAGVKMQSGVFALSPETAAELLQRLARGGLVDVRPQEVRDIDEAALREGKVISRFYGELLVPSEGRFLQHTKVGGREDPELAADDIAAWMAEKIEPGHTWLLGPGTTTAAISRELGVDCTLLGVDVVRDGKRLLADATEQALLELVGQAPGPVSIVVSPTGGQGYLFGRGNQQFSAQLIRTVGLGNIQIVATKSKISALDGRPLLVDTNDPILDVELAGYYPVISGYQDQVLYRVGTGSDQAGGETPISGCDNR